MKTLNLKTLSIGVAVGIMVTIFAEWAVRKGFNLQADCKEKEYPDNIIKINLQTLLEETARYYNTHVADVGSRMQSSGINGVPSRAFHLPIKELKTFIYQIEKKSGMMEDDLGINFIYTIYPKGKTLYGADVGGLHTLVLVPTRWDANRWMEFDPITKRSLESLMNSYDVRGINFLGFQLFSRPGLQTPPNYGPLMRNQGGLCTCPSGTGLCPCPNTILLESESSTYNGIQYR